MIASRAGRSRRVTLGADRGYDTAEFVAELRALNVVAHVAQNTRGRRADPPLTTVRHGTRATGSVNACANGSKSTLAG